MGQATEPVERVPHVEMLLGRFIPRLGFISIGKSKSRFPICFPGFTACIKIQNPIQNPTLGPQIIDNSLIIDPNIWVYSIRLSFSQGKSFSFPKFQFSCCRGNPEWDSWNPHRGLMRLSKPWEIFGIRSLPNSSRAFPSWVWARAVPRMVFPSWIWDLDGKFLWILAG